MVETVIPGTGYEMLGLLVRSTEGIAVPDPVPSGLGVDEKPEVHLIVIGLQS